MKKIDKSNIKLIFLVACIICTCATSVFASSFSGFIGADISATAQDWEKLPSLGGEAFFAGQYSFADLLILRTELSVNTTGDILKEGVFQKTPAEFSIDEVSITFQRMTNGIASRIGLFAGEYESIGSDVFLQRHFGIPAVSSRIMQTWKGLSGPTIYPFSGIGLAYVLRFLQPVAIGFYAYGDKQFTPVLGKNVTSSVNSDIRVAGAWNNVTFDAAFGVNFPIETKLDDGTNVIGLMRYVNLRGGMTLLIGNSYASSVFLQAGVSKIKLQPTETEKIVELSNIYILLEPRFVTKYLDINFTVFNIPNSMKEKLFYITTPLGTNISIASNQLTIAGYNVTFGGHLTLGANYDKTQLIGIDKSTTSLQFSPYFSMNIFGGELNMAIRLDFFKLPTITNNLSFTAGYRVQL